MEGDKYLYYKEIRDLWITKIKEKMMPDAKLLIIFDGCFSGGWVQENLENNDNYLYSFSSGYLY